jgi:formylglycine-generating enzyme required for sulfatase activity
MDIKYIRDDLSRLLRGGSFDRHAPYVRSASRVSDRPSLGGFTVGFRVARTYP